MADQALKLAELLMVLASYNTEKQVKTQIAKLQRYDFSALTVPTKDVLASDPSYQDDESNTTTRHKIRGISSEFRIFPSLARPKRIAFIGDDGRSYHFLCKPKDDLRKDSRLLDFCTMLNGLFRKHPGAGSRRLNICTYGVVPLNEECGLIEFVANMQQHRLIWDGTYKRMGLGIGTKELGRIYNEMQGYDQWHRFKGELLRQYPPIFHIWFAEHFQDARRWFHSRM